MENGTLDVIKFITELTTSGILLAVLWTLWKRHIAESDRFDIRIQEISDKCDTRTELLHSHYGKIIDDMRKELTVAYAGHIKQVTDELRSEREQSKYERLTHRFSDTQPLPPKGMLKTEDD